MSADFANWLIRSGGEDWSGYTHATWDFENGMQAWVNVALYDAVAGADGSYRAFRTDLPTPGADPQAAASVAAHRVLIELYPARVDELDTALERAA